MVMVIRIFNVIINVRKILYVMVNIMDKYLSNCNRKCNYNRQLKSHCNRQSNCNGNVNCNFWHNTEYCKSLRELKN